MYQTINFHRFQDSFTNMGRGNQFSYEALEALFNYLDELEECTDSRIELDVIGLCCEYREIEENEEDWEMYVGEEAEHSDEIIAMLETSVLVRNV